MSKELDNIMEFEDLEDLVHEYDIRVCKIFDQHAPLKTKKVTIRNEIPWFTNDALKLKIQTRNAERHWKKHKTLENWLEFCRNHELLLRIMQNCFRICDMAMQWIASYLSGRSFVVHVNSVRSAPRNINFSVLQGSINGPVYFTCYSSTLGCVHEEDNLVGYAEDHSIIWFL